MNPFVVVVGTDQPEPSEQLRDELRASGVSCVVLAEPDPQAAGSLVPACVALAAAGISALVATRSALPPALLEELDGSVSRVLVVWPPAKVTAEDLRARGWIPAEGEVYTDDELATVTARLRDLGYA